MVTRLSGILNFFDGSDLKSPEKDTLKALENLNRYYSKFQEKIGILEEIREALEKINAISRERDAKIAGGHYVSIKDQITDADNCLRKLTGELRKSKRLLNETEKILNIDKRLLNEEQKIKIHIRKKISKLQTFVNDGTVQQKKEVGSRLTNVKKYLVGEIGEGMTGFLNILRAQADLLNQIERGEEELLKNFRSLDRKRIAYKQKIRNQTDFLNKIERGEGKLPKAFRLLDHQRDASYFRHRMDLLQTEIVRFAEYCRMEGKLIGAEKNAMDQVKNTITSLKNQGLVYSEPALNQNNVEFLANKITVRTNDKRGIPKSAKWGIKGVCIIMPKGIMRSERVVVRFLRSHEKHSNIVKMLLDGMKKGKLENREQAVNYLRSLPDSWFRSTRGWFGLRKKNFLSKIAGFEMQLSYESERKKTNEEERQILGKYLKSLPPGLLKKNANNAVEAIKGYRQKMSGYCENKKGLQIVNIEFSSTILDVKSQQNAENALRQLSGEDVEVETMSGSDFKAICNKLFSLIDKRLFDNKEFELHVARRGTKIHVTKKHIHNVLGRDYGKQLPLKNDGKIS